MSFGVCKSTAEIAPHIKSFLSIIAGKKIQNNNNKITSFSFSVYNTHEFFYTFILFSSVLKFPFWWAYFPPSLENRNNVRRGSWEILLIIDTSLLCVCVFYLIFQQEPSQTTHLFLTAAASFHIHWGEGNFLAFLIEPVREREREKNRKRIYRPMIIYMTVCLSPPPHPPIRRRRQRRRRTQQVPWLLLLFLYF